MQHIPSRVRLTEAEKRIYRLMLEYRTNAEIAEILGYSEATVRQKVHMIYQKLGIDHRSNNARLIFLRMMKGGE